MSKKSTTNRDLSVSKPISAAVLKITSVSIEGASNFLSKICMPAAEEFGFLLKDRVSAWRARNAVAIATKAEEFVKEIREHGEKKAHPRIVMSTLEYGSWHDNDSVQDMWAGLLASACTEDGEDDSNILYINMLSQLSTSEARLLNFACENSSKYISVNGRRPDTDGFICSLRKVSKYTGIDDRDRLSGEFDHLKSLKLLSNITTTGPHDEQTKVRICPTSFALQMYVRCQGYAGPPAEYYRLHNDILVKRYSAEQNPNE